MLPPLQAQSSTSAPSAVEAPVTSKHRPDWLPVTVPLELTVHCWLVPPLQVHRMALVPLVVPLLLASKHRVLPPTVTVSSFVELCVQAWFA